MSDPGEFRPSGFPEEITIEWLEEMQALALWPESVLQTTGTMFLETPEQEASGVAAFVTLLFSGHVHRDGELVAWTLPVSMAVGAVRQLAIELLEITKGVRPNNHVVRLQFRDRDADGGAE